MRKGEIGKEQRGTVGIGGDIGRQSLIKREEKNASIAIEERRDRKGTTWNGRDRWDIGRQSLIKREEKNTRIAIEERRDRKGTTWNGRDR